jgi:hypothetical protein
MMNGVASGQNSISLGNSTTATATDATAVGKGAVAVSAQATALGTATVSNVVDGVAIGRGASTNLIAGSVAIGAAATPVDTAHALAFGVNALSLNAGADVAANAYLGVTINGVGYRFLLVTP